MPAVAGKRRSAGQRHTSGRPVVRPEIDVEKLARAFLNRARDQARKRERMVVARRERSTRDTGQSVLG